MILTILDLLAPFIVLYFKMLYKLYSGLTSNASRVLYGLLISFFGGSFPVAISV